MRHKADKVTHGKRLEVVYRLILDGWTSPQIVENITSSWQIEQSQAYKYIRAARRRMERELETYRKGALEEHIAARRKMRKEARDGRLRLSVLQDEAKLLGLYPPEKRELTGKGGADLLDVQGLVGLLRQAEEALRNGGE